MECLEYYGLIFYIFVYFVTYLFYWKVCLDPVEACADLIKG